jgi:Tol biopolymer transport system component
METRVPGDTNGQNDVFVYDRDLDTVERVSVADNGTQSDSWSYYPSISADGGYVAFSSYASTLVAGDTNGQNDVFVYDRDLDTIARVSVADDGTEADGSSEWAALSADGRYVVFASYASTVVLGDTNAQWDVFVYDRDLDTVERVSVADDGTQSDNYSNLPAISADGRYVGFYSYASNLVPGDTNGTSDVFVTGPLR